jgi:hypothetical protein
MKQRLHRALYRLADQSGINNPWQSVHSMRLIHVHQPRSKRELLTLLDAHTDKPQCPACGLTARGGMVRWTRAVHRAAIRAKRYARAGSYTHCINVQDCALLVHHMKVQVPFQGFFMELKAMSDLSRALGRSDGRHATQQEDTYHKVDVVFPGSFGVQVKPESYRRWCDGASARLCMRRQQEWDLPVYWLYYSPSGEWVNFEDVKRRGQCDVTLGEGG